MINNTENNAYKALLAEVKDQIKSLQLQSVTAANKEMLLLYWKLGLLILRNQTEKGWGSKVIDMLSGDLRKEFPRHKGFSVRNLNYMRKFALEYPIAIIGLLNQTTTRLRDSGLTQTAVLNVFQAYLPQAIDHTYITEYQTIEIVQQAVAQNTEQLFRESVLSNLSWSHHIILMDKEAMISKRFWYMLHAIDHGMSRNMLAIQMDSGLFERQVMAEKITNFKRVLPSFNSDYADYMLKDPYIFDFVQAKERADERSIEEQLEKHITRFLLELGKGFAFVARQMHFQVGNSDFYADLVFYHIKLKCYVIVELKVREFEPGDASQLNFYVNLANDFLKSEDDQETIGLLLCKGKNEVVAEYSLKGFSNAIGISDYQLSRGVPLEIKSNLPDIEEIENELKDL